VSARALLPALALLLAACVGPDRIVLLPDNEGKVGRRNVANAGGETLLDSAYATASAKGSRKAEAGHTDADAVHQEFGTVLAALPPAPVSYTVYFISDTDDLTADSRALAPAILGEIAKFPAAEVVVIGHTDTQGSDEYNDKLSLDRARAVKQQLIALGFDAKRISTAGRGKRELLIVTKDDVAEPRNRRAEILVR